MASVSHDCRSEQRVLWCKQEYECRSIMDMLRMGMAVQTVNDGVDNIEALLLKGFDEHTSFGHKSEGCDANRNTRVGVVMCVLWMGGCANSFG